MKGSIRKRKKNAWSYRIDLGFVDGKRKQVEKGGFKTEREAVKAMQDALYHLNNTGDYVENKKISFHTVYEEFIEREGKATRAYATLKKYDSLYRNHIKEQFGPLYVYKISYTMIIDFLNLKRQKYSEEYVKGLYKFFNVILRYAHEHQYTKKNVMDLVPPPPDPRHVGDIVTYTREELEKMIQRIESTRSKIAFQIGLQAGLRESDRYEIRHSDEDWGEPVELAHGIGVNYYGTVLTREPIQLPISGWIDLSFDDIVYQDDGCRTLAEFQQKYPASEKDTIDFYSVNDMTLHKFYFSQDEEQDKAAGCIGHLRGDFGNGHQFYTTWWPHQGDVLNTLEFKTDINRTVNWLREQPYAPLKDLDSMKQYCGWYQNQCTIQNTEPLSCGFMMKTKQYVYI